MLVSFHRLSIDHRRCIALVNDCNFKKNSSFTNCFSLDNFIRVHLRLMDTGSLAKAAAQHVWRCDRTGVSCRHYVCRQLLRHQFASSFTSHALSLFTDLLMPLQPRLGFVLSYSYNSNQFLISFFFLFPDSFPPILVSLGGISSYS